MTVLTVGAGQKYATIASAVGASHDGDVLNVQAGTYTNDFAEIKTKITLQAVGGVVHMVATGDIPNDKGILVTDTDVTIDHFEFSGAKGASGNDAGIRYQGGTLTLTNDYFHDNQNGLLSAADPNGVINIKASEFSHNGAGDGYTHNLYVGAISKLNISDSYFHDAVVGHEIKSRAAETDISNTRVFDNSGSASYSIDLPNGGHAIITGSTIEQGPNSANPNIIAFGEEGNLQPNSSISFTGDTVLNDLGKGTLLLDASNSPATVSGTRVWGLSDAQMASGSGVSVSNTTHLSTEPTLDTSHPWSSGSTPPSGGGSPSDPPPAPAPAPVGVTWTGTSHADQKSGTDGADNLSGQGGNDLLLGDLGDDTLNGGSGRDTLVGGRGDDLLVGGGGNDVYKLEPGGGHDTVNGFAAHGYSGAERDHFDISALSITAAQFNASVHISDTAAGALISVGDTSVTVAGMHASSFSSADFIFA